MAPIKRLRARAKAASRPERTTSAAAEEGHNTSAEPDPSVSETAFTDFAPNKRDKRLQKHHALVGRIAKSAPGRRGGGPKRRRPGRKLVADLGGLLGALPDVGAGGDTVNGAVGGADEVDEEEGEWAGLSDDDAEDQVGGDGKSAKGTGARRRRKAASGTMLARKRRVGVEASAHAGKKGSAMEMKTVRTRPGATKRRAKLEGAERERFAANMARMVGGGGSSGGAATGSTGSAQGADRQGSHSAVERFAALRAFIGQTRQEHVAFANAPVQSA